MARPEFKLGTLADRRSELGKRGHADMRLEDRVRIQGERFTEFIATVGE